MLSAIAIVPSAPVVVPELSAGAVTELSELREAMFSAAAALPARWVAVGVGRTDALVRPPQSGTFAGYGVDVAVTLSADSVDAPTELPLCALVAGWLRGKVMPEAATEVRVCAGDTDADSALERGRQLRVEIDSAADTIGVLIVADGANTLTQPAPGGYDPDSRPVQAALDDALAAGDAGALARLPQTIVGRAAYHVLAGIEPRPRSAKELYRGAPYGVGYFAGVWLPAGRSAATGESTG